MRGGRNHLEQLHGEGGLLIGPSKIQMEQRSYQEHRLDREKAQEVLREKKAVPRAEDSDYVWQRGKKQPGMVDKGGTWA